MQHSNSKAYKISGGVLRSLVITLALVIIMTATSFADVTIEKEWDDGLTGAKAGSRSAPTVNLEGTTSYEQLLNLFYPVGCYFETTDTSFDPNTAWGGTWVEDTSGKVIVGAGGDYNTGATGGEATHTLTVAEMPSHMHEVKINNWAGNLGVGIVPNGTTPGDGNWYGIHDFPENGYHYSSPAGSGSSMYATATGGGGVHNNMQPYIVAKRWHRTA